MDEITKMWGSCCSPDRSTNMTSRLSKNAQRRTIMSESPSWYGERESEKDSERGDLASIMCTDVLHAVYTLGVCALGLTRSSYPELPLVRSRRCPPKTRLLPTTHDRHGRSTHASCNDGIYARCMRVRRMYYFPLHSCSVVPGLHSLAATHILFCVSGR